MSDPLLEAVMEQARALREKKAAVNPKTGEKYPVSLWQATTLALLDRVEELELELEYARMFPELPEGEEAKRRLERALLEDGDAAHENYCKQLRRGR
mgnify:CR=1 FL=1